MLLISALHCTAVVCLSRLRWAWAPSVHQPTYLTVANSFTRACSYANNLVQSMRRLSVGISAVQRRRCLISASKWHPCNCCCCLQAHQNSASDRMFQRCQLRSEHQDHQLIDHGDYGSSDHRFGIFVRWKVGPSQSFGLISQGHTVYFTIDVDGASCVLYMVGVGR